MVVSTVLIHYRILLMEFMGTTIPTPGPIGQRDAHNNNKI